VRLSLLLLALLLLPPTVVGADEPLAGYANGGFFLRDPHDWFVLFPRGRLNVDLYTFPARGDLPPGIDNNGPKDTRPHNSLFIRRARIELQGTFMGHFDFHIAGEFASTPATGAFGTVADAYVIVDYLPFLKLQVGQFDAPFTLENRTTDKFIDFMERSMAVRALGVPSNKELGGMLLGWLPRDVGYYTLGLFDGDGQNFRNQDNYPAVIGRAFIAPLAPIANGRRWMKEIWAGGSFWYQRSTRPGAAVTPSVSGAAQNDVPALSTQGGVTFLPTNYGDGVDLVGNAVRAHLSPSGETIKGAFELNVPIRKMGLRFELVYASIELAQYADTNPSSAKLVRGLATDGARLAGTGLYVEVYAWLLGDVTFLEIPGIEAPPRVRQFAAAPEPRWGLMLAARYEHLGVDVSGLPTPAAGGRDPAEGSYVVDAVGIGINAWATKHIRLTANYVLNYVSGDAANVKANFYYRNAEHELLFRLGVAL
jgi:hypothetical protein